MIFYVIFDLHSILNSKNTDFEAHSVVGTAQSIENFALFTDRRSPRKVATS